MKRKAPQGRTAADFAKALIFGTKQTGLRFSSIEDLFEQAIAEGVRRAKAELKNDKR